LTLIQLTDIQLFMAIYRSDTEPAKKAADDRGEAVNGHGAAGSVMARATDQA
jgi:hypothetical protein